ncbi:MAG: glutamine-hydrolyzing carbamoyl-phosphate synthase small subunit [Chloroflexi bacterium]|nr:glutamine-hydrolyzing carbamoyl-phosphate synthase small subunit [Chloroflexota bacterium]
MTKTAMLVLADGSSYEGISFGANATAYGEVVFNTSMTGYQEMLTDPSYAGQILMPTYPLIGNYGIGNIDIESRRIQVRGFVVREHCDTPSHWYSCETVHGYLAQAGVTGLAGVDTRAITMRLRSSGVMMGVITSTMTSDEALKYLKGLPKYDLVNYVAEVTTDVAYRWDDERCKGEAAMYHVVALDCGLKYNIARILARLGCSVTIVPCTTSAEDILSLKPDGIVLSPGPGDPALLDSIEANVRKLIGARPLFGICLGHQMLGRAFGADTFKLKFGHRGGNHPVRDVSAGRVHITAQNHGYAVDPDKLKSNIEVSHINLNDGTVEGLRHRELPAMSIQYHSEASPGPRDNMYLFERFVDMMRQAIGKA